jgi:hypothetical protein
MLQAKNERSPAESGLDPLYEASSGAWIGPVFYPLPFTRISVYDGFIAIKCMPFPFIIKDGIIAISYSDIAEIRESFIFFKIVHTREDIPGRILIGPLNKKKALANILPRVDS